jgi:hypothetical protein
MSNRPNIVLILKSGGDFKMSDVYLLVSHINKYWQNKNTKPAIYCYTDLVTEERAVVGLTIRPIPNRDWRGWWSKMNMFAPSLKELRPFLYMDIDTAVVNTIDPIIPPKDKQDQFIALRDFYRPAKTASGLMWVPNTSVVDKVYSEFIKDVKGNTRKYRGDQDFIFDTIKADLHWQDVFGEGYITTFKPNREWRMVLPPMAAVICFHGKPRIPEAAEKNVEWVQKYVSYAI